jgi:fibronectin type 3 domain-containing protein
MRINLTWTDNATNEAGFRVYRSSDGGATWSVLVQLGANVGNYVDSSVAASRTYSYRVTAFNGAGESAFSNTATITTPGGTGKQSSSDVPFLDAPINDKRPWWLLS